MGSFCAFQYHETYPQTLLRQFEDRSAGTAHESFGVRFLTGGERFLTRVLRIPADSQILPRMVLSYCNGIVAGRGIKHMTRIVLNIWKDDSGQDLIEYALMAGFVAVAAGAIMPGVSSNISSIFSKVGSVMQAANTSAS